MQTKRFFLLLPDYYNLLQPLIVLKRFKLYHNGSLFVILMLFVSILSLLPKNSKDKAVDMTWVIKIFRRQMKFMVKSCKESPSNLKKIVSEQSPVEGFMARKQIVTVFKKHVHFASCKINYRNYVASTLHEP